MKKISKYLKISTFAFVLAMMCFVSVSAGTLAFTEATPILQGWKELSERTKDQSSYMSISIIIMVQVQKFKHVSVTIHGI